MSEKTKQKEIVNQYFAQAEMNCAYETKVSKDDKLELSQVADHQVHSLYAVKHGTFHYKISDESQGYKPFDGFSFHKKPAYVVAVYKKFFALIDIDVFLAQEKAISADTALDLADIIVQY